jgi:hypothetical protein
VAVPIDCGAAGEVVLIDLDQQLESALNNRFKYGDAKGLQATADDMLKGVYALLYDEVPDDYQTAPERDAWVKNQHEYKEAVLEKAKRYSDWEAARLKMQILFACVEKYRTDASTERTMMKASQ